jgi:hypothetical protein
MEKKEILLPTKRYFKADEQDLNLNVKLENDEALLREGDKDIILNLADLFNEERNKSINYKIYGKIKMVFRNMYSGYTDYTPLLKNFYLVNDGTSENTTDSTIGFVPYNEFAFHRNDVKREIPQIKSGSTIGVPNNIPTVSVPNNNRFTGHTSTTVMEAPYKNWNLYLSYVYGQDTGFTMNYTLSGGTNFNFVAGNGVPFRVEDNGNYYTLTSPVEHGLSQGEYIILSGGTYTTYSGITTGKTFYTIPITKDTEKFRIFYIDNVGNEIYDSEKYVINILKSEFTLGTTLSSVVLGRRCKDINNISGTTSQYYVHKHKTLTTIDDYILDKVGFENTIWEDERKILFENTLQENDILVERNRQETLLFDFKNNFNLSGITNNLGYTPTEVYVSVIFKNENGFFDYPPKIGYKFNFHDSWIDNQFNGSTSRETSIGTRTFTGNTSGFTFVGGTITGLTKNTILTGAFVEYNRGEIKERIISETYHKFSHRKNTGDGRRLFNHKQDIDVVDTTGKVIFSGATPSNQIGYYYQPHYRIKLRELSPYIETSKLDATQPHTLIDLPENAIFDDVEKLWKWRDLYDHGFIDQEGNGTNFPFMNNSHYIIKNINFYLRNEQTYINKNDGLIGFNNYRNKTNC